MSKGNSNNCDESTTSKTRRQSKRHVELHAVMAQLRPHQWIYVIVLSLLAWQLVNLLTFSNKFQLEASFFSSGMRTHVLMTISFLFTTVPAQLFLQDAFTSKNNCQPTNSYFTVQSVNRRNRSVLLAIILLAGHAFLTFIISRDVIPLAFFIMQFSAALAYAGLKRINRPILALNFRGFSGGFLLLHFMAITVSVRNINEPFLTIAFRGSALIVFVMLVDAMVNLAGDIRDLQQDQLEGTLTIPVRWGEDLTVSIMRMMTVVACITLTVGMMLTIEPMLSIANIIGLASPIMAILFVPYIMESLFRQFGPWNGPWRIYYHFLFHGTKVAAFSFLVIVLMPPESMLISLIFLITVLVVWMLSYHVYIVNKNHGSSSMILPRPTYFAV